MRDRFTDPKTGSFYDFNVNHNEEDAFDKRREMTRSGKTALTGLVRIQGEQSAMVLRLKGTVLKEAQDSEFWRWWELCETQTIYYRDFNGDEYEGFITRYSPQRVRVLRNFNDPANMPHHIIKYELEFEVVRFISGVMATRGVSP